MDMASELILIIVIVTAVGFDFTNGFHDTANAVATSIATGALKPRQAVVMSATFNLIGAFISISVAAKIASGLISATSLHGNSGLVLVFAALCGAILWNLLTWYFTLPSSSSHALIGGIVGAALVGGVTVKWHSLFSSVLIPAVLSPFICMGIAALSTFMVYRLARSIGEGRTKRGYKQGQIISAALVSLAHGTNDAQKTMGVITLALIAYGETHLLHNKVGAHGVVVGSALSVPIWVKILCGGAIAAGTATGGWRIINTMGNRITDVESPQGFSAETASAAVILASSYYGYPLSTTHVVSGGVMGAGIGKRAAVHWGVAGQMATGWIFTIPAAGVVGAIAWSVADLFGKGSAVGALVIAAIVAAAAAAVFQLAQRKPITAAELDRTAKPPTAPLTPAPAGA